MSGKARHIDFYPDELISGVAGKMDAIDFGVYWMVCTLIYSHGGSIADDHVWISRLFRNTHWRVIRSSLDRLIGMGKVAQDGGKLYVTRCARELQKTDRRIAEASQNGRKGGRPAKEINSLEKADGFGDEKLTTNHQPPTTNHNKVSKETFYAEEFTAFWAVYPRKVAKDAGFKAYTKARKTIDAKTILDGAKAYAAECRGREPKFIAHAATWLNAGRWNDAPSAAITSHGVNREGKAYAGRIML